MSYTPLGVIVIVAATLAALALFNEHKKAQTHYQAARQEYVASKWVVPSDVAARRVHTDYKSYRDEWRSEQDLEAQREMARTSWWVMVATWIGVGLLILTLVETTKTSAAAVNAADASKAAVELARANSERQLRAYVNVVSAELTFLDDHIVGRKAEIAVQVRNLGATPARNVDGGISANLRHQEDGDFAPINKFSQGSIGPTTPIFLRVPITISADDIKLIDLGSRVVRTWGEITYDDIFGSNQITRFRLVSGSRLPSDPTSPITGFRMRAARHGNDAT